MSKVLIIFFIIPLPPEASRNMIFPSCMLQNMLELALSDHPMLVERVAAPAPLGLLIRNCFCAYLKSLLYRPFAFLRESLFDVFGIATWSV